MPALRIVIVVQSASVGGARFAAHIGTDIKHVRYRGASQAAHDTTGG